MSSSGRKGSTATSVNDTVRMNQVMDEKDHKRCTEGNRQALLGEKLESLKGLVTEIRADNWKYEQEDKKNSSTPVW